MNVRSALLVFQLTLACMLAPAAARAAESYDNCTGFITSLPTVIFTQGTWCLKQDLATSITTGNAITINTNNVTIDCNDFKLGGLAAGAGTQTVGIYTFNRLNSTIRHCNIRGFMVGIRLEGGTSGGHIIEDNRFDGNTIAGMSIGGEGSIIRRNRVFDTGGTTISTSSFVGILVQGPVDIVGNSVSGVVATTGGNADTYGIFTEDELDGRIVGNSVRGLLKDGFGATYGIYNASSERIVLRDNDVFGDGNPGSIGLRCANGNAHARDNEIANFATGINVCTNVTGNDIY